MSSTAIYKTKSILGSACLIQKEKEKEDYTKELTYLSQFPGYLYCQPFASQIKPEKISVVHLQQHLSSSQR